MSTTVPPGRLKTAEGVVDYAAAQITGREEPFHSEIRETLKGRTQALEDLAVELLVPTAIRKYGGGA